EVIRLREADTDGLPPGRCRIVSPYDTDARWGGKRDLTWCGYKLHISESCDAQPPVGRLDPADHVPDAPPNLITNVATTDAVRARCGDDRAYPPRPGRPWPAAR